MTPGGQRKCYCDLGLNVRSFVPLLWGCGRWQYRYGSILSIIIMVLIIDRNGG